MNKIRFSNLLRTVPALVALAPAPFLVGCTGSTAESTPATATEIKEGEERQIKAIQNNANMSPEAKRRALERLGAGAGAGDRR